MDRPMIAPTAVVSVSRAVAPRRSARAFLGQASR